MAQLRARIYQIGPTVVTAWDVFSSHLIQSQDEWMTQRESHVWIKESNPRLSQVGGSGFQAAQRTFGNHAIEVGGEMWEASRSKKPLVRHLGAAMGHWPFGNARFPRIMFALPVWRGCCFLRVPCPHPAGRPCSGVSLSRDKGRRAGGSNAFEGSEGRLAEGEKINILSC